MNGDGRLVWVIFAGCPSAQKRIYLSGGPQQTQSSKFCPWFWVLFGLIIYVRLYAFLIFHGLLFLEICSSVVFSIIIDGTVFMSLLLIMFV